MTKKYEYHKQNDYPGERVAEKERVAKRNEAAEKKADARVAKKGRTEGLKSDARVARKGRLHDKLMSAEIGRRKRKATRASDRRDSSDMIGLTVIVGLIILLIAGFVWSYTVIQDQSDQLNSQANELEFLKMSLADEGIIEYETIQFSDSAKQIQLYEDFIVMSNNVKEEVNTLENYDMIYSNMYQLCSGFAERENNINHALYRFAQKEIVYYEQIAVLAEKPECEPKIETMRLAMETSKLADEQLYVATKELCDEVTDNILTDDAKERTGWAQATTNAKNKADAFDRAQEAVVECFA